jgi:hypothetical protein
MPLFRVTFENRKHGFKRTLRVGAPDSEFAEDKAADLFFAGMTSTTKKLRPTLFLISAEGHNAERKNDGTKNENHDTAQLRTDTRTTSAHPYSEVHDNRPS